MGVAADEAGVALAADEEAVAGAAAVVGAGIAIAVIEAEEENAAGSRAVPIENTALHPRGPSLAGSSFFCPVDPLFVCPHVHLRCRLVAYIAISAAL